MSLAKTPGHGHLQGRRALGLIATPREHIVELIQASSEWKGGEIEMQGLLQRAGGRADWAGIGLGYLRNACEFPGWAVATSLPPTGFRNPFCDDSRMCTWQNPSRFLCFSCCWYNGQRGMLFIRDAQVKKWLYLSAVSKLANSLRPWDGVGTRAAEGWCWSDGRMLLPQRGRGCTRAKGHGRILWVYSGTIHLFLSRKGR